MNTHATSEGDVARDRLRWHWPSTPSDVRQEITDLLNRDPRLAPVRGVFAAQQIKPQARTLAEDRGIRCVVLDYDTLRGIESTDLRLF